MSAAPLLDTHAWVWWVDHDQRLGTRSLSALDALPEDDRPCISDISLWEVATLVERGRLRFSIPFEDWLEAATHRRSVRMVPIDAAIAAKITELPPAFHRDPADRVIVATSIVLKRPLLTKDRTILSSGLVEQWAP